MSYMPKKCLNFLTCWCNLRFNILLFISDLIYGQLKIALAILQANSHTFIDLFINTQVHKNKHNCKNTPHIWKWYSVRK